MTTIDIEKIYSSLTEQFSGSQKRIDIVSPLGVYYGLSKDGSLRLSFRSKDSSPKMESTKLLRVTQGLENPGVYWTCFDLTNSDAKRVFCSFCINLIESVEKAGSEADALVKLKKRFIIWKSLFKKEATGQTSWETIQGLYGELYFLKKWLLKRYDAQICIMAWSGPDAASKDFSIETGWFEVKTIGANTDRIHISSLAQLSSNNPGKLAVIRVEKMSPEFSNGESSILELFNSILQILSDEGLEDIFTNKVSSYGIDLADAAFSAKYDIKSMKLYNVVDGFPRITIETVPYAEISNVSYDISVGSIKRFLED